MSKKNRNKVEEVINDVNEEEIKVVPESEEDDETPEVETEMMEVTAKEKAKLTKDREKEARRTVWRERRKMILMMLGIAAAGAAGGYAVAKASGGDDGVEDYDASDNGLPDNGGYADTTVSSAQETEYEEV